MTTLLADFESPTSTSLAPQHDLAPQEGDNSGLAASSDSDEDRQEHILITHIIATNVVVSLRRVPAGFYVAVGVNGVTKTTSNKPAFVGRDTMEWDEEILLPSERSSVISFQVYASFELGPMLGKGEMLWEFKITVGELLDHHEQLRRIRFPVPREGETLPSCSSLHVIIARRVCDANEARTSFDPLESDDSSQLSQLTDAGHRAFQLYRQLQDQQDLDQAIVHFQRVQEMCLPNHPSRATALFNLANAKFIHSQVNNAEVELDVSIALYQDVLQLRPRSHPDHSATLLDLGFALLARFEGRGNEADVAEAKDLFTGILEVSSADTYAYQAAWPALQIAEYFRFKQAVELEVFQACDDGVDDEEKIRRMQAAMLHVSDSDPRRPGLLASLGSSLYHHFQRIDNLAYIHGSISMLEEAVKLTADGHPDKPAWLNTLGASFQSRFERLGNLVDMDKSTSSLEEALLLTPGDHPDKPDRLDDLGESLLSRFEHLGNLTDLDKSISFQEDAVRLTPDGHPAKPARLTSLAISLQTRFGHLGGLADMLGSISIQEEVVRLTPDGDPDKPAWLKNLGTSLLRCFERFGNFIDMDKSISMFEEAVRLTPDGHPHQPACLSSLGDSLLSRFRNLGDLSDLNKAILFQENALRLTPDGDPNKPVQLINLGNSLLTRSSRLDDLTDLNKSISIYEEALGLTPDGHPDMPSRLNNLGSSLSTRFERLDDLADLEKSISMKEQALRLTPEGHPAKPSRLNNLGNSLSSRFERLADLADLNKAILIQEEALQLAPDSHPTKPTWLSTLGISLLRRFSRLGDLTDMDKSVLFQEEALQLTSDDHPDKPTWLSNLSWSLLNRFDRLADLADLEKAISIQEEAVRLTPDDHPRKAARLNNLGISLWCRFQRLGDLSDLDKSISVQEDAARLTPEDPACLGSLGISLSSRFGRLGSLTDMENSILNLEEAVRLTPDGHPRKQVRLNNLGILLSTRFAHIADPADLDKAILIQEEVVRLTPDGHPAMASHLNNLGKSFLLQFNHSQNSSSLASAVLHCSSAACASAGPPSIRFQASLVWISCARLQDNPQSVLDAFTVSVNLLQELAWIGLPLKQRHQFLLQVADTARDAASAALAVHRPDTAVELLEQGRSIVWSQLLQLRTPVDELHVKHPVLADQFKEVSEALEQASSRENPTSNMLADASGAEALSLEKEAQKHRQLALTREKLLANIRLLPGFERFLLPHIVQQLAASAHSGPVVFLNASEQGCDALIVMSAVGDVIHVPLSGVNYADVAAMYKRFTLSLGQRGHTSQMSGLILPEDSEDLSLQNPVISLTDDDITRLGRPAGRLRTPEEMFTSILERLWKDVVRPVLEALPGPFLNQPSVEEKKPRIFWCPTGPFAFLPIHAAGLYTAADPGVKLSDLVISSYTPTLSALASSQEASNTSESPPSIHLLAVPQPDSDGQTRLKFVATEIDDLRILSATSSFVKFQDSNGTVEDVLEKMKGTDWVHFACHGVQDPHDPLNSGLCLADGRRLSLSEIIRLSRTRGGLAFLSACQTAKGDEKLSEEAVHLAAGMLLAGYSGVIATMWSIMDNDAPKVTKAVYKHLFRDGKVPDSTEAAEALHYAVQRLRDSGANLFSWVPFIHVGR